MYFTNGLSTNSRADNSVRLIQGYLWWIILVHMHHSVEESPEQDVSEKTADKAPGEEQPPWFKELIPPPSGLQDEQQGEEERGEDIENEAVQSSQPEDASGGSGQSGHRSAAVIQHGGVPPHSDFTDELWSLTLGYNCCHLDSGQISEDNYPVLKGDLDKNSNIYSYDPNKESVYSAKYISETWRIKPKKR